MDNNKINKSKISILSIKISIKKKINPIHQFYLYFRKLEKIIENCEFNVNPVFTNAKY